jgi:hypothetical protein
MEFIEVALAYKYDKSKKNFDKLLQIKGIKLRQYIVKNLVRSLSTEKTTDLLQINDKLYYIASVVS